MASQRSSLPIDDALPALTRALAEREAAVLVAPPGAGKTTRVPLVLADEPWAAGRRIIVLEPRRLAARAAAARMAATLGETVGDTVGLRVRFGAKLSRRTRIEIVTEGVFTRMILDDPALDGIAGVLFDEFHERSLDADLGLALARDAQLGLREDLKLLVMSATLDGARVAALLGDAPVIESEGRAYPVTTRYLGRDPRTPIERQVAAAVRKALGEESGSVLAFLPGAAEIRRAQASLQDDLDDPAVDVVALYGALEGDVQDRAVAPAPPGRRKVVLATAIAETSLTIEGVRIVVDSGLARVPRYEPDVGLTRLETVRVSRASADQRRGRAGRTEPGVCYRLWDEPQTASLEPSARPEVMSSDLAGFLLDLAHWGVTDPAALPFLDPPPVGAVAEARALLRELGAIEPDGRMTDAGRHLRALPLPPRLARMVLEGGPEAAEVAVLISERGLGGNDPDLVHRLDAFRADRSRRAEDARALARRWREAARSGARAWAAASGGRGLSPRDPALAAPEASLSLGATLALAYPDRIAKNRGGEGGGFLLANGRGARVDPASPLAREPYLAVADMTGERIQLAAPITLAEIDERLGERVETQDVVAFDEVAAAVRARRLRRLGALVLAEQRLPVTPGPETAAALADGLARRPERLPWTRAARQFVDRVAFLRRAEGEDWPDLTARPADWLAPALADKSRADELSADDLLRALADALPWPMRRRLEAEAPTHFEAPTGSHIPIDYAAEEGPKIAVRVQELFGLDRHPAIAAGRVPLVIELLSPAHRPVQVTRDLPGFWRGSYAAVRVEMRGRYPKHPWPDDPLAAPPTRRAKPRGT